MSVQVFKPVQNNQPLGTKTRIVIYIKDFREDVVQHVQVALTSVFIACTQYDTATLHQISLLTQRQTLKDHF